MCTCPVSAAFKRTRTRREVKKKKESLITGSPVKKGKMLPGTTKEEESRVFCVELKKKAKFMFKKLEIESGFSDGGRSCH